MAFANLYFQKFGLYQRFVDEAPNARLGIVVAIPCLAEPDLLVCLESLFECRRPGCAVEVVVVINSSVGALPEVRALNEKTFCLAKEWSRGGATDDFRFYFVLVDNLPAKYAGAGLARKIAMDEALRRFDAVDNQDGVIACFDADSVCDENYLVELERGFVGNRRVVGANIYFEHPIAGDSFEGVIYEGIVNYELHLRYYKNALAYCLFPYAYHTVGSSMAVRASVYARQGGMNKRTAGEDFYFLQKIFPLGHFIEINTTRVIPSPRASNRVPFGTGAAMSKMLALQRGDYLTYNPEVFDVLKYFFANFGKLFKLETDKVNDVFESFDARMRDFLIANDFERDLAKINDNSPNIKIFTDRFFQWFNAFRVLKFVNFMHESYCEKIPVAAAANIFACKTDENFIKFDSNVLLLQYYRAKDKQGRQF